MKKLFLLTLISLSLTHSVSCGTYSFMVGPAWSSSELGILPNKQPQPNSFLVQASSISSWNLLPVAVGRARVPFNSIVSFNGEVVGSWMRQGRIMLGTARLTDSITSQDIDEPAVLSSNTYTLMGGLHIKVPFPSPRVHFSIEVNYNWSRSKSQSDFLQKPTIFFVNSTNKGPQLVAEISFARQRSMVSFQYGTIIGKFSSLTTSNTSTQRVFRDVDSLTTSLQVATTYGLKENLHLSFLITYSDLRNRGLGVSTVFNGNQFQGVLNDVGRLVARAISTVIVVSATF